MAIAYLIDRHGRALSAFKRLEIDILQRTFACLFPSRLPYVSQRYIRSRVPDDHKSTTVVRSPGDLKHFAYLLLMIASGDPSRVYWATALNGAHQFSVVRVCFRLHFLAFVEHLGKRRFCLTHGRPPLPLLSAVTPIG